MPELSFFMNRDDEIEFIKYIFLKDLYFIPDIHYDKPEYIILKTMEEYLEYRKKMKHYFLMSKKMYESPIEMDFIIKNDKKKYFIYQRNGGPHIDLLCSGDKYNEDNKEKIGQGGLSYYNTYWSTKEKKDIKANLVVKETYKDLIKFIKKNSMLLKTKINNYWIGNNLNEEIKNGVVLNIDGLMEEYFNVSER